MLKEEHLIDLVDCVGQVDGGLDHVGEADPGDLHDVLHVGEGNMVCSSTPRANSPVPGSSPIWPER